jgi:hypothetical protein
MTKVEVRVEKRWSYKEKQEVFAPFINNWNVWEFNKDEWTPNVQRAILYAYQLGREHQSALAPEVPQVPRKWPK